MTFLNSVSSAAALVLYLPGVCTHTDTDRKQSPEYFKIFEQNTIFNEHPVPKSQLCISCQGLPNLNSADRISKLNKSKYI